MADGILMLNDHCFLQIFNHLSLHDLANVKEAYKSLGAVTDMEFRRITRGSLIVCGGAKIHESLQIIKRFGSSVEYLDIYYELFEVCDTTWTDIFSIVSKHCNENLKKLSLGGESLKLIKEAHISLIADLLKNVETIRISCCSYYKYAGPNDFFNILSHCENAKSITVSDHHSHFDPPISIFQKNKNLLRLEWDGHSYSHFKTIVDNLMDTRIEELRFLNINGDASKLIRLKYLKRLSVDYIPSAIVMGPLLRIVDAISSLHYLSLDFFHGDEAMVTLLERNTRLKVLRLTHSRKMDFEHILGLCGNKHFEHLLFNRLGYSKVIDEAKFLRLIKRRVASTAENCLHIALKEDIYNQSIKAIRSELLEANKNTIKLIDPFDCNNQYAVVQLKYKII